jgi:hypothetical protein
MRRLASLPALVSLLLYGCATSSSSQPDFVPTGSITTYMGAGASFNANRVVGPKINVSQRGDGSWGGTIGASGVGTTGGAEAIDATFNNGQLVGANIRLNINRAEGQTTITGQWKNRIVRFEVTADEVRVRTDTRSNNFPRVGGPGEYGGRAGVNLVGEAIVAPPTPAFALAMLGAFI